MHDQNEYNRRLIEEFRATRDAVGVPLEGRPMMLLTTTGAKSGQPRVTPLMYIPDGERLLVIASNLGAPKHPDWYHNLATHPQVGVEVGAERFDSIATTLEGTDREQTWSRIVAQHPFFVDHQQKTSRQIPVVALKRSGGPG